METKNILKNLENMLHEEGLDCTYTGDSEDSPFEFLMVFLGNDPKGREKILQISAQNQELAQSLRTEPIELPEMARVQFQILFPFQIVETSSREVGSLVCFLNGILDLPGIEMNEAEGNVYYRYILLAIREDLNKHLILSIIGIIMLTMEIYADLIEQVSKGEITFNEVLEKVIQTDKSLDDRDQE